MAVGDRRRRPRPVVISAPRRLPACSAASGDVLDFAVTYLRIAAARPAVRRCFALGAQGVQRGAADYRTPLVILLTANAVNAVLEVLFVYGFDWGVPGSAWSTVIVQVAAGVASSSSCAATSPGPPPAPELGGMAPLLTRRAPPAAARRVDARRDERDDGHRRAHRRATLAAHQIGASLFLFLALGLDALAIPAQTLVAEELGQGSHARRPPRSPGGACGCRSSPARPSPSCSPPSPPVLPHAFTADPAVISRATAVVLWLAADASCPAPSPSPTTAC